MESNPKQGPHSKQVWMTAHPRIKVVQNRTNRRLAEIAEEGGSAISIQFAVGPTTHDDDGATFAPVHAVLVTFYPPATAEVA